MDEKTCLIFIIIIRPNSHINRTTGEIAILGVRSLRRLRLLSK